MPENKKYSAPALEKGLDIIEYLASKTIPLSQAEIASGIGRSPNEIYRVLVSLEERRYIVRGEVSGKYRLSLKLYSLAYAHSPLERLREASALPLRELAEVARQSCHISLLYEGKLLVVSQVRSPEPVSLSIAEGTLFPLISTASGRVILANMPDEVRQDILQQDDVYVRMSAAAKASFQKELENIVAQKYYMGMSDITIGVTDCASFVGRMEGGGLVAVAVSGLSSSISRKGGDVDLVGEVLATAMSIRGRLGL